MMNATTAFPQTYKIAIAKCKNTWRYKNHEPISPDLMKPSGLDVHELSSLGAETSRYG